MSDGVCAGWATIYVALVRVRCAELVDPEHPKKNQWGKSQEKKLHPFFPLFHGRPRNKAESKLLISRPTFSSR
jgi:hypothetical protein